MALDGRAAGCCGAMARWREAEGKQVHVRYVRPNPSGFASSKCHHRITGTMPCHRHSWHDLHGHLEGRMNTETIRTIA